MRFLSVICLFLSWTVSATALTIEEDTHWEGEKVFAETVRVAPEASLTIAAGTKIHFEKGGLEVAGRLVADGIELFAAGSTGILLKGCDKTTKVSNSVISGAKIGIKLQGGSPTLEALTLSGNGVGIEVRGKAAGTLSNSVFDGNKKVGLFVKDDSTIAVTGCRFANNGRFGAYLYRGKPGIFARNVFVGNQVGLMVAYHGSDPLVEDNSFEENEIAIQVDRAARPTLKGNLLLKNKTGLYAYRRSDPVVIGNLFQENEVGVLLAFSSYPTIEGNDLVDNGMAIKLESQSAEWEKERGKEVRATETASRTAFSGQGMRTVTEEDRKVDNLKGLVEASHNWWGEAGTKELSKIGAGGNPSFILDGRDEAHFVDGGKEYKLDKVVFSPWSVESETEKIQ